MIFIFFLGLDSSVGFIGVPNFNFKFRPLISEAVMCCSLDLILLLQLVLDGILVGSALVELSCSF